MTEAAMGRIAQGTKVLAEGGYEKIFLNTFETVPDEQLRNSYACYLSTSAGPVMGVLYISTAKIAYSSDNPISYKTDNKTEWSYYKVNIQYSNIEKGKHWHDMKYYFPQKITLVYLTGLYVLELFYVKFRRATARETVMMRMRSINRFYHCNITT